MQNSRIRTTISSWKGDVLKLDNLNLHEFPSNELFYLLCNIVKPVHELSLCNCKLQAKDINMLLIIIEHMQWPIKSLNLAYNNISSRGVQYLLPLLYNNTLESFNLSACNIGVDGLRLLGIALQYNTSLQCLNLYSCHINENTITEEGWGNLITSLQHNNSLRILNLQHNKLSHNSIMLLADMLKENTILQELNLSGNCFRDPGIELLTEALKSNTTLCRLVVKCNLIGIVGMSYISEMLKINSSLQEINLSLNTFADEGLNHLLDGIESNKIQGLRKIILYANGLTIQSHRRLATLNWRITIGSAC